MGLFGSKGRKHLDGHKDLSKDSPILTVSALKGFKVYFPTMSPNKKAITYTVKPGDKVLAGQKIGSRTDFDVPVYSSVSGTVLEQEKVFSAQIGSLVSHLVIESDGENTMAEPLKTVSLDSSKEEILAAIKEAGLVGMGGAGFPTYVKYATTAKIDTLVINGVECEPFLTTDFVSMVNHANELVSGIKLLLKVVGAERAIIAIKVHKDAAKEAILTAIDDGRISLVEVPDQYPMGWERLLIKQVTKRTYKNLPSDCGIIVNNAQTVIALNQVLTTGHPITDRLVTVSGDAIVNPTNVCVKIGTLASELIEACGGYSYDGEISLIPGGPMCTKAVANEKFPILIQDGALTILKYKELRKDACLRCGACSAQCPAGLQPVELKKAFDAKDSDRMLKLHAMDCIECGTCSYVCPSRIEVTDYVKKCKVILKLRAK